MIFFIFVLTVSIDTFAEAEETAGENRLRRAIVPRGVSANLSATARLTVAGCLPTSAATSNMNQRVRATERRRERTAFRRWRTRFSQRAPEDPSPAGNHRYSDYR